MFEISSTLSWDNRQLGKDLRRLQLATAAEVRDALDLALHAADDVVWAHHCIFVAVFKLHPVHGLSANARLVGKVEAIAADLGHPSSDIAMEDFRELDCYLCLISSHNSATSDTLTINQGVDEELTALNSLDENSMASTVIEKLLCIPMAFVALIHRSRQQM